MIKQAIPRLKPLQGNFPSSSSAEIHELVEHLFETFVREGLRFLYACKPGSVTAEDIESLIKNGESPGLP
jgi:hypothetical protein